MPQPDADWNPIAFKEWQVVCEAIEAGEHCVILRKGGIAEGRVGFQWLHRRFFLFPTQFHEQGRMVCPAAGGGERRAASAWEDGFVRLSLFAEAITTGRLTDWDDVCHLEPYHIWTRDCIRERFEWGEEPGISFAVIRVFRLVEPWILEDRRGFGGCRSWIDLPPDENGGFRRDMEPILCRLFDGARQCLG